MEVPCSPARWDFIAVNGMRDYIIASLIICGIGWTIWTVEENRVGIVRIEGAVQNIADQFTNYERRISRLESRR